MNNKKLNIDDYTENLVKRSGIQKPSSDFTKSVMCKILRDPAVNVRFVTYDERKSNLWLMFAIVIMLVGTFGMYLIKYGANSEKFSEVFKSVTFIEVLSDFISGLWAELTISPYILLGLLGVIILVIIDKAIVRYIYSI